MRNRWGSLLPRVFTLLLALVVLQTAPPASAAPAPGPVVEHLRLRVPRQARSAWLEAERRSWESWLEQQKGFLGRDLYWDPAQQEGVLLIRWATLADWKRIDPAEVGRVQQRFEAAAREALGRTGGAGGDEPPDNPFPLVYSGALEVVSRPGEGPASASSD